MKGSSMRRQDAEDIAAMIAMTIFAIEKDSPERASGAKLIAIQLADLVERDGRMDGRTFLKLAGILPRFRKGKGSTLAASAVLSPPEPVDGPPGEISQ